MFSRTFGREVVERAVKTVVQAFLAATALGEPGVSVFGVDWRGALGLAAAAGIASVVTSLASARFGPRGSASTVQVE